MVTPIHRFVSLRRGVSTSITPKYNLRVHNTPTPSPRRSRNRRFSVFKWGLWMFFAIVALILAGTKFYIEEGGITTEVMVICSLVAIILILGGSLLLYKFFRGTANSTQEDTVTVVIPIAEQQEEETYQVPMPSYRVSITWSQNDPENKEIAKDSPTTSLPENGDLNSGKAL